MKPCVLAPRSARLHVLARLERAGVAAARVDLLPLAPANADHLGTYSGMDVSLDPFPYAGTTTTCESLYMGVPCITLAGGASLNLHPMTAKPSPGLLPLLSESTGSSLDAAPAPRSAAQCEPRGRRQAQRFLLANPGGGL